MEHHVKRSNVVIAYDNAKLRVIQHNQVIVVIELNVRFKHSIEDWGKSLSLFLVSLCFFLSFSLLISLDKP